MYERSTLDRGMVRNRIFLGLFGTLLSASAGAYVGQYLPPALYMPLWLAGIVMLIAAGFVRKRAIGWTFVTIFTLISGMSLTPILLAYSQLIGVRMVLTALFITAGTFGVTAFVGSRKSVDFTWLGSFLFAGLITLIGLGLVGLFIPFASAFDFGYTYLGIIIFVGYMLFDVNRITRYGLTPEQVPGAVLSLYLDFINLFLFILRLFGLNVQSRNS